MFNTLIKLLINHNNHRKSFWAVLVLFTLTVTRKQLNQLLKMFFWQKSRYKCFVSSLMSFFSFRNVANLLGNRLSVPNAALGGQGMSSLNIKAEPTDRDTSSPNSHSSISPTSPYQVQRRLTPSRDEVDKDGAVKRPRLDGSVAAAYGLR